MLRYKYRIKLLSIFLATSLLGCGDPGDDEGNVDGQLGTNTPAAGTIVLTSTSLATTGLLQDADSVNSCSAQIGTSRVEGVCLTPINVSGSAHFIDAVDTSLTADFEDQARIAKAGSDEEVAGEILPGNTFDLLDTSTFSGENELFSAYERKPLYTQIAFESQFLSVKFKAAEKFVTMLLVTHPQPFVDADFLNEGDCALTADEKTQERFVNADIFSNMTFERGDYLFCVKDNGTDTCAASDYQWFDTSSEQLVSTRPSSPRINRYFTFDEILCNIGDRGTEEFNNTGIRIFAELDANFQLYADYSHGINSAQWPEEIGPFGNDPDPEYSSEDGFEEPYVLYYYQPENGSVTEGTELKVTFDFDVADMLIIPNMTETEADTATLEEILAVVDTKTNIGFDEIGANQQEGHNPNELVSLSVTTTIELTGDRDRPEE